MNIDLPTLESILLALLVVDAIALVVLVLLQQGKGADVGAAFGSGSANSMFGSLGAATFFTKATAWLAIGFFAITFGLAFVAKQRADAGGDVGIPTAVEAGIPVLEETPIEDSIENTETPVAEPTEEVPEL